MTRKIHTTRPRSNGARVAWDAFSRIHQREPDAIWFTHLSWPVWVAQYGEDFDDLDNLALRSDRNAKERG